MHARKMEAKTNRGVGRREEKSAGRRYQVLVSSRRRSTPRFDQFSFLGGHYFCWRHKAELLEQWLACMVAGVV